MRLVTICVFIFKSPLLLQCLHYSVCAGICIWGRKILNRKAFEEATAIAQVEDGRDLSEKDSDGTGEQWLDFKISRCES